MAYAALGRIEEAAFPIFDKLIASFRTVAPENEQALGKKIAVKRNELLPGLSNADLIATFQAYVGNLLLSRLSALLKHKSSSKRLTSLLQSGVSRRPNLVLAGGCGQVEYYASEQRAIRGHMDSPVSQRLRRGARDRSLRDVARREPSGPGLGRVQWSADSLRRHADRVAGSALRRVGARRNPTH
jgi:hypothetical protein